MTEQSEHLSSAQIENYGIRTSGAGPEAAQRDEHQRLDHQSSDDQRVNDQQINDRKIHDRQVDDLKISDLQIDDQRVEAHLADCASCRNRLLDFHRSLFAPSSNPPEPDRPKADKPKNDELKADPPEHDTSLSGHSPSGHSPSGQRPADSRVEGASPTNSALADSKFANPKYPVQAQVRTAPTPECPSDDALRQLAAGLTPDDVAAKLTQHAATCNHCGPLLRTYTEIFSDDFTPEEQAALANLQSRSADWQKNTARQMLQAAGTAAKTSADAADTTAADTQSAQQKPLKGSTTTTSGRKPVFWKWVLVPATAAVVAVATFSIWYTQRDTPEKVEKLLAQTYPEHRTTEMRGPGTPWGEPKETLGPATLNQPRTLLAAKDAIQRQTPETLRRTEWVHLKAQSEILGGMPSKQLIDDLTKATQSRPVSQSLMFDLAIANFRMGEVADDRNYYLRAKTVLDEMLTSFPPSSAALFDRAVAEERLQLRDQAVADLTRCLTLESDPAWSGEIQEKIKKLESPR